MSSTVMDKNYNWIYLGDTVVYEAHRGVVNSLGSVDIKFKDEATGEEIVCRPRFCLVDLEASPERDRDTTNKQLL